MSEAAVALRTGDESGSLRSDRTTVEQGLHARARAATNNYYAGSLVVIAFPTGEDTRSEPVAPVRNLFSRIELQEDATGYGWFRVPVLGVYAGGANTTELDETDTLDEQPQILPPVESAPVARLRTPEGDAAARIRELTALPVEKLAEMFGVSRVAYHNWLKGTRPRGEHRDRLLFVQQFLEEAGRIIGEPRNVGAWLLSPSPVSGRVPIELLKAQQYDLCRSLLTRRRGAQAPFRKGPSRRLAGRDLRDALRAFAPPPALDDYGDVEPTSEDADQ